MEILKITKGVDVCSTIYHGTSEVEGVTWNKATLELSDDLILPVLFKRPTENGNYRIITSPAGKGSLLSLDEIKKSNDGIILFDPICFGETAPLEKENTLFMKGHIVARSVMWLGETLMGKWSEQLIALKKWGESELGASSISISGYGELGVAALFAEALDGGFNSVKLIQSPMSYKVADGNSSFSMGIHIPGIIPWGDISMAVALCSSNPEFIKPMEINGNKINDEALKVFMSDIELFSKKLK